MVFVGYVTTTGPGIFDVSRLTGGGWDVGSGAASLAASVHFWWPLSVKRHDCVASGLGVRVAGESLT